MRGMHCSRALVCSSLALTSFAFGASAPCPTGQVRGVRIDYEASIPSLASIWGEWAEVQRAFPDARGITRGSTFVTREKVVEISEGVGLAITPSEQGTRLMIDGRPSTFRFRRKPLRFTSINTRTEHTIFNDTSVMSRRKQPRGGALDLTSSGVMTGDEWRGESVGTRTYATLECEQRRVPGAGAQAEACVREIQGWPITLYMQVFDSQRTQQLQWKRAVNISQDACMSEDLMSPPVANRTAGDRS